jgi:hypothetical protein
MSTDETTLQRRFAVHEVTEAPSRARMLDGVSFEDAALHFIEDRHLEPDGDEVSLMVEECETGERQCFRIDLETGETAPCA